MNKEDIIYEFKNIVEESRTEDRQDYYIRLRNALDLIQELEEENAMLKKTNNIAEDVTVEDITQVVNKSLEEFKREFIPISVIQNKIDELDKEYRKILCKEGMSAEKFDKLTRIEIEIETLDELLEERK